MKGHGIYALKESGLVMKTIREAKPCQRIDYVKLFLFFLDARYKVSHSAIFVRIKCVFVSLFPTKKHLSKVSGNDQLILREEDVEILRSHFPSC